MGRDGMGYEVNERRRDDNDNDTKIRHDTIRYDNDDELNEWNHQKQADKNMIISKKSQMMVCLLCSNPLA